MDRPSAIKMTQTGAIARIRLDRPEKHNALEVADLAAFSRALTRLAASDSPPRALILTGAGDKSFCSGVSLSDVGRADLAENPLTALCDQLEAFAAPTICALNGGVYGGGVEIALSCDLRIGVKCMRMFSPPARLGIHYEAAGLARAAHRLGVQAAKRIFLAVETFDAEALLAMGFVDQLVEPADLADAAQAKAQTIADLAPLAVQGMKTTLNEIAAGRLDPAAARARVEICWGSADHREGLAAFRAKRKPVFKGR